MNKDWSPGVLCGIYCETQKSKDVNIEIKRIYEDSDDEDGTRVLVDRLWPRGVSKEDAKLDEWWKEVAPSDELRKWFDHLTDKWPDFKKKYRAELKGQKDEIHDFMKKIDKRKRMTLLYGAKDEEHNQAVVLKSYLGRMGI